MGLGGAKYGGVGRGFGGDGSSRNKILSKE